MAPKKRVQQRGRQQGGRQQRVETRAMEANLRHEAELQQRAADFNRRYRHLMMRRIAGFTVAGVGGAMILVHVVMHLGNITLFPLQDLLIGYPTGGILMLIGLIVGSRA
ncbi:MAG: hypothetical protein M3Z25_02015 [Actinomycetota bacterium]|nr:hypothetical protein [Actinomycetota bacterium]